VDQASWTLLPKVRGVQGVSCATATFDPTTFYWHITIELAYGTTGPLGQVGDVYLHAATGAFAGAPQAEEFRQRAEALAAVYGIE